MNAIRVIRNGKTAAYFKDQDSAEMYISLMQGTFLHLAIQWETEAVYVDNLNW